MEHFILQAKAVADPTRIRMLKLLEGGERCVCEIMEVLDVVQSTASKHLNILKAAGLVESRKNGTWSYYRLAERSREHNRDFLKFIALHLNDDGVITRDREVLTRKEKRTCRERGGRRTV
jgi:DNA-binding transcriptional ArsR family regulator